MIFIKKIFIYSIVLISVLSSCTKEVELDQLTVSTNIMNRHNPYIIQSGDDYYGINETIISGNSSPVQISTQESAGIAIKTLDNALNYVSTERGKLGALSNRLSSTMSNLDQITVNLSASQGRIQDADFAQETGNLANEIKKCDRLGFKDIHLIKQNNCLGSDLEATVDGVHYNDIGFQRFADHIIKNIRDII